MPRRFTPKHIKRKRRRTLIGAVVLLFLLIIGGSFWYYRREATRPVWKTYTDDSLGVSVDYPSTFKVKELDEKAQEAGYLFEIKRSNPDALFTLRYEDGLGPLKAVKGSVFAALVDAVNRRYPSRFPGYQKEAYEETSLANEQAARFDFTYTGSDGKTRVKQRLFVVVKDDIAYYLVAQAPVDVFAKSEKDFGEIIDSFSFTE